MEPIIRIKEHQLKELKKMLAPDEALLVAATHGKATMEQGRVRRADEQDYLLLTDKRVIDIKGRFFRDRIGFRAHPRRLVTGADYRHYLIGCTITILFRGEREEDAEHKVEFHNCGKADAEAVVRELTEQIEMRRCPKCTRQLKDDHTFCPMCGAALKRLCPRCGKHIPQEQAACPHCGGG